MASLDELKLEVERHITKLLQYMASNDIAAVRRERNQFDDLLQELDSASRAHRRGLSTDELREFDNSLFSFDQQIRDFKSKMYSLLSESDDAKSLVSSRSKTSSRSSASDRAMRQAAKVAALEAAKVFAKKEAELELQKHNSRQIEKELSIEKELAIARAEMNVYQQYESIEQGEPTVTSALYRPTVVTDSLVYQSAQSDNTFVKTSYELPVPRMSLTVTSSSVLPGCINSVSSTVPFHTVSVPSMYSAPPPLFNGGFSPWSNARLNVSSVPGAVNPTVSVPLTTSGNITSSLSLHRPISPEAESERLIVSLSEALKQSHLPKIELSVFSGDHLEFQRWLISFEKLGFHW